MMNIIYKNIFSKRGFSKMNFTSLKNKPSHDLILNPRQLCDLECIGSGAFNPLNTFLNQRDYNSVINNFRLDSGELWPMPITLDLSIEQLDKFEKSNHSHLSLRDAEFNLLALLKVEEVWTPDKKKEGQKIFGGDPEHPTIKYLHYSGDYYVSGKLDFHQLPIHYDYNHLRHTPSELKKILPRDKPIVAFQTRNPMHKAHMELVGAAASSVGGIALIHPVVGLTKSGDIDYHTRIKCYQQVLSNGVLETQSGNIPSMLSLLPLAMRMGGPAEALWHALIRQNYGATHFICGRDHAGPGSNSSGVDFYSPYAARDFLVSHQDELDIEILSFEMMQFVKETKKYTPISQVKSNQTALNLSGTEVRKRLKNGQNIPDWFSPPEVVEILQQVHPPIEQQGLTLFFTGLSGSGKSTIANALIERLHQMTNRPIITLDGDEVRTFLSSELGFSKKDRDLNIKRIGYVSSLIAKSRGVSICAAIAPFAAARNEARQMIENQGGNFIEIYVNVDLAECENRDRKGLYYKARQGLIPEFTGIDSPYEEPLNPDINLDASNLTVSESVDQIINYLQGKKIF